MDKVNISLNLLNALLAYLSKKPYEEVVQLVAAIQQEYKEQTQDV